MASRSSWREGDVPLRLRRPDLDRIIGVTDPGNEARSVDAGPQDTG